uniref:Uncharacterized protein n=1 Tax=Anguilla anguilla TaxID=7936 RepID=A0A0E9TUM5_ANGAN
MTTSITNSLSEMRAGGWRSIHRSSRTLFSAVLFGMP